MIDEATNAVTATITVGSYPDGVAVDPATHTVYVPTEGNDTVSVIDEATNAVTATIPVGTAPYGGVAVDPATHTVYVTTGGNDTVSVIDEATGTVTATIAVGTEPIGVAVDPAAGTVYVTNISRWHGVGDPRGDQCRDRHHHRRHRARRGGGRPRHSRRLRDQRRQWHGIGDHPARAAGCAVSPGGYGRWPGVRAAVWRGAHLDGQRDDPAATLVRVERASGAGFTAGVTDFSAAAAATSYTDTAVAEGTTYYYRVRAENDSAASGWS